MITIVHRLIGGLGRVFVATGLLVLAFAVFRYWGTGIAEARAQEELGGQFRARLASVAVSDADLSDEDLLDADLLDEDLPDEDVSDADRGVETTVPRSAESAEAFRPADVASPGIGEAAGRIIIPAIDVDKTFVQGVGRDDLRKGPGHYPQTVFPGQPGNAAIAGHRTTYGAPFFDLDKLVPGDEIVVETLAGRFVYSVDGHEREGGGESLGHFIVEPTATWVLEDHGDSRLTLTACHPKRSAAQRIVVTATLEPRSTAQPPAPSTVVEPAPEPNEPAATADETVAVDEAVDEAAVKAVDEVAVEAQSLEESLGWRLENWPATALWATLSAFVAAAGWLLGRRWRRIPAYAVVAGPFLVCLFVCFTHLDRLLPAV